MASIIKRYPLFLLIALLVTSLGLRVMSQSIEAGQQEELRLLPVAPYTLAQQNQYLVEKRYSGIVSARQHANLGFELNGKLAFVNADEGDLVKAGDTIAELDSELLSIERRNLQAQLTQNRAELKLTENNLKRQTSLQLNAYSSEQAIDELKTRRSVLIASDKQLAASLAAIDSRIRKSTLKAPFDGIINQRFADAGAVVSMGSAVVQLQQTGGMEAHIGVPLEAANKLSPGENYPITLGDTKIMASVISVGAELDSVSRTINVRLALPSDTQGADGDLLYLNLEQTYPGTGFWIPTAAVTDGFRGLWQVYVLKNLEGGVYRLEARDIKIIYATEDRFFVQGAISDGEEIVSNGMQRLVPGQRVTSVKPQTSTESLVQTSARENAS